MRAFWELFKKLIKPIIQFLEKVKFAPLVPLIDFLLNGWQNDLLQWLRIIMYVLLLAMVLKAAIEVFITGYKIPSLFDMIKWLFKKVTGIRIKFDFSYNMAETYQKINEDPEFITREVIEAREAAIIMAGKSKLIGRKLMDLFKKFTKLVGGNKAPLTALLAQFGLNLVVIDELIAIGQTMSRTQLILAVIIFLAINGSLIVGIIKEPLKSLTTIEIFSESNKATKTAIKEIKSQTKLKIKDIKNKHRGERNNKLVKQQIAKVDTESKKQLSKVNDLLKKFTESLKVVKEVTDDADEADQKNTPIL